MVGKIHAKREARKTPGKKFGTTTYKSGGRVKKMGGGTRSIYGTTIGVILGMFFFPPFGIVLGAFLGAFLGALMDNKEQKQAISIALGALLGFLCGTFLKLIYSVYIIYVVVSKLLFLS